jgi:peptidoglycan/LPS O-acetylase OafA/YrhL
MSAGAKVKPGRGEFLQPLGDAITRFYSLDILRGVAALGVVFWHWQHFFAGSGKGQMNFENLPLYRWFFLFYESGWLAVDLFFGLSGFVFYWLYSKSIAERSVSPLHFGLLRFSRLYPLHFASLVLVAIGQLWYKSANGSYFIYVFNDAKHFLLNIFFISSWGFERGFSFNGPVWSVSIEVLLYLLFFIGCRFLPVRPFIVATLSIIGFFLIAQLNAAIGRGVGSFFLGGCVFLAYKVIIVARQRRVITKSILYLAIAAWAATLFFQQQRVDLHAHLLKMPLLARITLLQPLWPVLMLLFPLTILALALVESRRGALGKRLSFIGDISYSSYLIHFPLQLAVATMVSRMSLGTALYYSPWFLGLFFFVLISICFCSYHCFEVPLQKAIRRMIPNSKTGELGQKRAA